MVVHIGKILNWGMGSSPEVRVFCVFRYDMTNPCVNLCNLSTPSIKNSSVIDLHGTRAFHDQQIRWPWDARGGVTGLINAGASHTSHRLRKRRSPNVARTFSLCRVAGLLNTAWKPVPHSHGINDAARFKIALHGFHLKPLPITSRCPSRRNSCS